MYYQDWLMSQIEGTIKMIMRMFFKKDIPSYEIINKLNQTDADRLYLELDELLKLNKINEAENLLFEKLTLEDINCLNIALDFYSRLNGYSDEQLEQGGFSRDEIKSGLDDIAKQLGISIF
jgi:hypothetical protein